MCWAHMRQAVVKKLPELVDESFLAGKNPEQRRKMKRNFREKLTTRTHGGLEPPSSRLARAVLNL